MRKRDNKLWEKDIATKKTLDRYRRYKTKIKQDDIYDNRYASVLYFKARTGTLDLNTEKRHKGEDTTCDLCKTGEETDIHFLLECETLKNKRDKGLIQKYDSQDKDEIVGELLFREKNIERVKQMIDNLWRRREVLRKKKTVKTQLRHPAQLTKHHTSLDKN